MDCVSGDGREWSIGVIEVANKRIGIFDEHDENLLRAFAEQAAVAIESYRVQRSMVGSQQKLLTLLEATTMASESADLAALMDKLAGWLPELFGCERGDLFAFDAPAEQVWTMHERDGETEEIRFPAGGVLPGLAAITGKPINLRDAYGDYRFNPEIDRRTRYRTRNVMCVPLRDREGNAVGALQICNRLRATFVDEDERLLHAIASQLGTSTFFNP